MSEQPIPAEARDYLQLLIWNHVLSAADSDLDDVVSALSRAINQPQIIGNAKWRIIGVAASHDVKNAVAFQLVVRGKAIVLTLSLEQIHHIARHYLKD